jgi:hypothetical protein
MVINNPLQRRVTALQACGKTDPTILFDSQRQLRQLPLNKILAGHFNDILCVDMTQSASAEQPSHLDVHG